MEDGLATKSLFNLPYLDRRIMIEDLIRRVLKMPPGNRKINEDLGFMRELIRPSISALSPCQDGNEGVRLSLRAGAWWAIRSVWPLAAKINVLSNSEPAPSRILANALMNWAQPSMVLQLNQNAVG